MSESKNNYFHINRTVLNDLWIIDVGHSGDGHGGFVRNNYPYFLIQYVEKGKGVIEIGEQRITVRPHHFFVIFPDKDVVYYPEEGTEWQYYWINFNGLRARNLLNRIGITEEQFVGRKDMPELRKYFERAFRSQELHSGTALQAEACLFSIFSAIEESQGSLSDVKATEASTFERIFAYVQENLLSSSLTAQSTADYFHLNAHYFSTLFKKNCNITFKEYVNYERIKKASELLLTSDEPIKNIAVSIGYEDPLYFAKVFAKYRLMPPTKFRESNRKAQ